MDEVRDTVAELGFPVVVRPIFTMGGLGSGMAYDHDDLDRIAGGGLAASPTANVLIEESILGWKEFELELMRDGRDNVVVVCSIENVDPMGVHTGDSVTVAPAMTLTDREYQKLRDLGIAILREVGVDTGGCNIQFAVNPTQRPPDRHRDEPARVALVRAGVEGDGLPDREDRRQARHRLHARRDRQRHHQGNPRLLRADAGLHRREGAAVRVREVPGRGRDADHHDEVGRRGDEPGPQLLRGARQGAALAGDEGRRVLDGARPGPVGRGHPRRPAGAHRGPDVQVERALRYGASVEQVAEASGIDPWFVEEVNGLVELRAELVEAPVLDEPLLRRAKYAGLSDRQIAALRGELAGEDGVRSLRHRLGVRPVYKTVDTCAAEFEAKTPYHYSSYELDPEAESEVAPQRERDKVIILGSGPNRIGQGIEFDYSCVHAAQTLSQAGFETVMVNCNPETVSTDYDTADRLYFEPLTFEDVLEVVHAEEGSGTLAGVIVQLGGQTPLGLAQRLADAGVPVVGTSPEAINLAEDRGEFGNVLVAAGLPAPRYGTATTFEQAKGIAAEIGYPVLVRPSYVLGGRGMEIVYDEESLDGYISRATEINPDHPVLVDRFLDDAIEIDVDALCDGLEVYLGGVMEHIEEAGIHSGDSACALPPITLGPQRHRRGAPRHRGPRDGYRGARTDERAVRAQGRRPLRARGQPAGEPHGAVRVQGDRGAAGQGGRADHARRHHRRAARRGYAARRRRRRQRRRSTRRSR